MTSFFSKVALTVIFVVLLMLIRTVKGEFAMPLSVCFSVSIAGAAIALCAPIIEYISSLAEQHTGDYLTILLKTVGVSLVSATAADICRDSGENAIAAKVELLGKCEILILSLPLLEKVTELVFTVLEG